MKRGKFLLITAIIILPILAAACTTQVIGGQDVLNEDQARQKAEQFIKSCPTFTFDGIGGSLVLKETLYPDIENAWTFVFEFESRQSGYGDRAGQMLLQVITPHEVMITVEQGNIITAIMDGAWDMLAQAFID